MSLQQSLSIIKNAYPFKGSGEQASLLSQMTEIIKEKTNNFQNPQGISTVKVDMKNILQSEKISPAQWQKEKGSFQRSEADVVQWLAYQLQQQDNSNAKAQGNEQRIRIAKAKAKAKIKLLEIMTF